MTQHNITRHDLTWQD